LSGANGGFLRLNAELTEKEEMRCSVAGDTEVGRVQHGNANAPVAHVANIKVWRCVVSAR
jgi:hypothetical protein